MRCKQFSLVNFIMDIYCILGKINAKKILVTRVGRNNCKYLIEHRFHLMTVCFHYYSNNKNHICNDMINLISNACGVQTYIYCTFPAFMWWLKDVKMCIYLHSWTMMRTEQSCNVRKNKQTYKHLISLVNYWIKRIVTFYC